MSRFIALLLALVSFGAASVRAQQPAPDGLGTKLVPSHQALLERRERVLAAKLEHLLRALPGVNRAVAEVTLADASRLALDESVPPAHVSLVLLAEGRLAEESLPRLIRDAAPELALAHVAVTRTDAVIAKQPSYALRRVGPFRVASDSDLKLRVLLAVLLASNVLLASLLLARRFRGTGRVL